MDKLGNQSMENHIELKKEFLRRLNILKGNINNLIHNLRYSMNLYLLCYNRFGGKYIIQVEKYKEMLVLAYDYRKK